MNFKFIIMANQFFLIFLATILLTRIAVYLRPVPSPTIGNFRLHHYMYGIALIIIGLIISFMPVYAVGLGLFIDELTYLIIRGKTHEDNYSKKSLVGTIFFIILVFFFRDYIVAVIQ